MGLSIKYINVTNVAGSIVFSPTINYVDIHNTGGNPCYIAFGSPLATTSNFKMMPDDTLGIELSGLSVISGICESGAGITTQLNIAGADIVYPRWQS
jgi:hypothetical protein